jgi:transposase
MGRPALQIRLAKKDRTKLNHLLSGGVQQVRTVLRALALVQLSSGMSAPQIAETIPLCSQAVRNIAKRYSDNGLEGALYDKPRPGAVPLLDKKQRKRIIAMVCGEPPEGFARWTVRLVAEEAVKRRLVPKVGRETIRLVLLHDDLKPWRGKNVVVRRDKPAWSRG